MHSYNRVFVERALRVVVMSGVILLGVWLYGPSLALPASLVDEYVLQRNADLFELHRAEQGWRSAVAQDLSVTMETCNLGFFLWKGFQFKINGGQPFHWMRMLELALVCVVLFRIVAGTSRSKTAGFTRGLLLRRCL